MQAFGLKPKSTRNKSRAPTIPGTPPTTTSMHRESRASIHLSNYFWPPFFTSTYTQVSNFGQHLSCEITIWLICGVTYMWVYTVSKRIHKNCGSKMAERSIVLFQEERLDAKVRDSASPTICLYTLQPIFNLIALMLSDSQSPSQLIKTLPRKLCLFYLMTMCVVLTKHSAV